MAFFQPLSLPNASIGAQTGSYPTTLYSCCRVERQNIKTVFVRYRKTAIVRLIVVRNYITTTSLKSFNKLKALNKRNAFNKLNSFSKLNVFNKLKVLNKLNAFPIQGKPKKQHEKGSRPYTACAGAR